MARSRDVDIRVITPDDWPVFRALRLRALADAPEAFGSSLADWQGAGDTEGRWRSRLEFADLNVIAYLDHEAVGMASGVIAGDLRELRDNAASAALDWEPDLEPVELISMWVTPQTRGRGVATAVASSIISWAESRERDTFLVVRGDNAAAQAMYGRLGFADLGPRSRPIPGDPPERIMLRRAG